jgi:hypothetical protein
MNRVLETNAAIQQSEDNAEADWWDAGLRVVKSYAEQGSEFTANDILESLHFKNVKCHNKRAVGSLLLACKKKGWIKKTDKKVLSVHTHATEISLWQSCLK